MKIETHEVDTGSVTQLPEPQLANVEAWVITAIDMKTRKPVVIFDRKEKGMQVPFSSFDRAKQIADSMANKRISETQNISRLAFIRIQKLEVA